MASDLIYTNDSGLKKGLGLFRDFQDDRGFIDQPLEKIGVLFGSLEAIRAKGTKPKFFGLRPVPLSFISLRITLLSTLVEFYPNRIIRCSA